MAQAERIAAVDILRGVALLGVLLMNIPFFAMPERYSDAFDSDMAKFNL